MNINSKSQIVFGISLSEEEASQIEEYMEELPDIYIYSDLDDTKILGFLAQECTTYYSFSSSTIFTPLSTEKIQEISELLSKHFAQKPAYFLIAQCS